jgi:hypothetical protein
MIERPQWYNVRLNQNATGPSLINSLEKKLDSDAPFRLWGIGVLSYGSSSLNFVQMRMTRPDRSWIQRFLTPITAINPYMQDVLNAVGTDPFFGSPAPFLFASPISPNLVYPPGGTIVFDFSFPFIGGGGLIDAQIVLVGTKMFREGAVWAPTYPPKPYRSIPFLDYALQIAPPAFGAAPLLDVPFDVQPDADFVWQAGQHTAGAVSASLQLAGEALALVIFTAVNPGTGGNAITIFLDSGAINQPFSITVVASAIHVFLQTNGLGAVLTTGAQLSALMNANPAVAALVTTQCFSSCGDPSPSTLAPVNLAGGANVGPSGGIGIRFKDWSGKYYMDDFTPAEIMFGFGHAQAPGLLYPEIYIPRNQALYFDFQTQSSTPPPVPQLTLSLKGQKVYGSQS